MEAPLPLSQHVSLIYKKFREKDVGASLYPDRRIHLEYLKHSETCTFNPRRLLITSMTENKEKKEMFFLNVLISKFILNRCSEANKK